jgi:hypothetical protein
MSSPTATLLTQMLNTVSADCDAIEKAIAADPPETTDQLLILRELQRSFRTHCDALHRAIREFE